MNFNELIENLVFKINRSNPRRVKIQFLKPSRRLDILIVLKDS